jgi:hypothetical protein
MTVTMKAVMLRIVHDPVPLAQHYSSLAPKGKGRRGAYVSTGRSLMYRSSLRCLNTVSRLRGNSVVLYASRVLAEYLP